MRWLLLLLLATIPAHQCSADILQQVSRRDWKFPFADGSLTVRLTTTPSTEDGKPIYVLQIITGTAAPGVADETGFLRKVVTSMQSEGMSPTRIAGINLELREPDVSKQLAMAAGSEWEWTFSGSLQCDVGNGAETEESEMTT